MADPSQRHQRVSNHSNATDMAYHTLIIIIPYKQTSNAVGAPVWDTAKASSHRPMHFWTVYFSSILADPILEDEDGSPDAIHPEAKTAMEQLPEAVAHVVS